MNGIEFRVGSIIINPPAHNAAYQVSHDILYKCRYDTGSPYTSTTLLRTIHTTPNRTWWNGRLVKGLLGSSNKRGGGGRRCRSWIVRKGSFLKGFLNVVVFAKMSNLDLIIYAVKRPGASRKPKDGGVRVAFQGVRLAFYLVKIIQNPGRK